MKYRIGELCRILNMPVNVIRFYEEKGIVSPTRDAQSGFRVYGEFDIRLLISAKTYRSLGYSLEETRQILQNPGQPDSRTVYGKRLQAVDQEIATLQEQKAQLLNFEKEHVFAEEHLSKCAVLKLPTLLWVYSFNENRVVCEPIDTALLTLMNRHTPRIQLLARVNEPVMDSDEPLRYDWGHAMTAEEAAYIPKSKQAGFYRIDARTYLAKSCIIDRECRITREMFFPIYKEADERGLAVDLDAPAVVKLLLGYSGNSSDGYLICFAPLKDEPSR